MKRRQARLLVSRVTLLALVSLFVPVPTGAHTGHDYTTTSSGGMIVDTDMGLDDVRAIFALLADPDIDIRAFVTVGGSASVGRGTDNLVGLLEATQSHSIKVMMGCEKTELDPPPWRETANGLGGATFPPPRRTAVVSARPDRMAELMEPGRTIEYLALGPLGNLDMLERERPGILRLIHTIWIPAVVRDGRMSDWNLLYDAQAAQTVFDSGADVVIIDMSGADKMDDAAFLSSLEGYSFPVLWINRLLARMDTAGSHIMVYDELAAVAFSKRDLLKFDDRTYTVKQSDAEVFELVPDLGGTIHVAKLLNCDGAQATLKDLWERGPLDRHTHSLADTVPAEVLLRSFHGHLGPYVVIGYRMGKLALDKLHSGGHFGISAQVHSPLETPRSCLIDGVQIGSGCTLGKRNIEVIEGPEPAWAVFESDQGEEVTIRLKPSIPHLVGELVDRKGVEAAGHVFFEIRLDSLFTTDGPHQ